MEFALVLAGGLVASLGALATQWVQRRWSSQDRIADRQHVLVDRHHDELRRAYSEFVAAANLFLDLWMTLLGVQSAVEDGRRAAYDQRMIDNVGHDEDERVRDARAVSEGAIAELSQRSRQALEEVLSAATAATARAVAVLLLEADVERRELVERVGMKPYAFVEADMLARREDLLRLVAKLSGAFAPGPSMKRLVSGEVEK